MSPRKFLEDDHKQQSKSGIVINGPRPSPLKLKQESHTIQKHHKPIRKAPIIIYIHSPEIIHTKPRDFMALVQKLTGLSSSKDQQQQQQQQRQQQQQNKTLKQDGYDLNQFSNDFDATHEENKIMKSKSPMFDMPSNRYVADIPLFTPNTSDYLFSPQRFLKLSDIVSSSPNMTPSLSPGSLVELMKGFV